MLKVMIVLEEIPERLDSGAQTYLRHFLDYCGDRRLNLTLLVTGHRFERLVLRTSRISPTVSGLIIGSDLLRIGPWSVVTSLRSWRHAIFSSLTRAGPRWMRTAALRIRGVSQGQATIIGRRLGDTEASRLGAAVRTVDPDVMLLNTIFVVPILAAKPAHTLAAVITHDVLHKRTKTLQARGLQVAPFITEAEESAALSRCDAIIAISDSDALEFRRLAPGRPTIVVSPPSMISELERDPDPLCCTFLGSGTAHNVDGMSWFLTEVWPRVAATEPRARLELIGAICDRLTISTATVVKRFVVNDLPAALCQMSFGVNPLLAGSGIKIKMIDYFANGVPTITTSVGAEGFPRNGREPFLVCDDAEEFSNAVLSWLRDPAVVSEYAARCRPYAMLFAGDAGFLALDRLLGVEASRPNHSIPLSPVAR
jgi:hypothetical protein